MILKTTPNVQRARLGGKNSYLHTVNCNYSFKVEFTCGFFFRIIDHQSSETLLAVKVNDVSVIVSCAIDT